MADQIWSTQVAPATPSAGNATMFVEANKRFTVKDDAGRTYTLDGGMRNQAVADVVANAADTYLAGSNVVIPTGMVSQAGMVIRWTLVMTKTAAGLATPTWIIRVGTTGTVADAARVTFTGPVQTANVDTGLVEIIAVLRNVGAAGVLAAGLVLSHNLAATGFANIANPTLQVNSAGFDTTVAGLNYGLSVNPGAAGVWTHQVVATELMNI